MRNVLTKDNNVRKVTQTMHNVPTKDNNVHKVTQIIHNVQIKTKVNVRRKTLQIHNVRTATRKVNVQTKAAADKDKAAIKTATKIIITVTKTAAIASEATKTVIRTVSIKKAKKVNSNKATSLLYHHVNSVSCLKYWNTRLA